MKNHSLNLKECKSGITKQRVTYLVMYDEENLKVQQINGNMETITNGNILFDKIKNTNLATPP